MHRLPATAVALAIALGFMVPSAPAEALTATPTASEVFDSLTVAPDVTTGYNRDLFDHWIDADSNGCDTRREVLIQESVIAATIGSGCVVSGQWNSWYDGASWTDPASVDIDHFVALAEAWRSGAAKWTADTRKAFANDLGYADSLIAVTDTVNQSKSDSDPAAWMPPLTDAATQCRYVTTWVLVKYRWSLTINTTEQTALASTLAGACGAAPVALPAIAAVALTPDSPVEADPLTTQSTVYRFWSPKNQTHFYTMNVNERNSIISSYPLTIWTYEGPRYQAFPIQQPGTVPLHRFWSPRLSGHFFTSNEAEKNFVLDNYDDATWTYEGVAFYVYPEASTVAHTIQVARFWSPQNQHHFYTASAQETEVVKGYPSNIWTFEGYNYRVPTSVALTIPPTPAQYVPPIIAPPQAPPAYPGDAKNCSDFSSYDAAKAWFDLYYPHYGDVANLDRDNDRKPCELLPGFTG